MPHTKGLESKSGIRAQRAGVVLIVVMAGAGFSACAQSPESLPQEKQPIQTDGTNTLRVETREVVLDVVVTDRAKRPVLNLGRDAFTVYEDKVQQRVVSFTKPEEHATAPDAPPVHSSKELVLAGNIPINVIILDELNTRFEDSSFGRSSADHYLSRQPATLKQATTILSISDSGLKQIIDYTQDREKLREAVKKHFPVYPFRMTKGGDSGPDAGERMARCLGALLQISQSVKGYAGRKSIIWIGRGFPSLNTDDVNSAKAAEAIAALKLVTSSLLESRTVLNTIDPTPLSSATVDYSDPDFVSPSDLLSAEGAGGQSLFPGNIDFASFAPATGGLAFYARNDVDRQIATAIEDGSAYYTLVYSPTDKTEDPAKFRQIVVKLNDPSLVVWTRTGYYRSHHLQPGEPIVKPDARQLAFDLMNAALSNVTYSGLIVFAEKAESGPGYRVTVSPVGLDYRVTAHGTQRDEVTIMEVCFDAKNKPLEHHPEEKSETIPDSTTPMSFILDVNPPKGTTRVRIVVRDVLSGRLGTVDIPN